jgi:hypothetical protein
MMGGPPGTKLSNELGPRVVVCPHVAGALLVLGQGTIEKVSTNGKLRSHDARSRCRRGELVVVGVELRGREIRWYKGDR